MKKDQGAILIFAAAILWSFAGLAAKYISWNAMSIACIRGVIGAITIGSITKQWFFRPTKAVWLGAFGTVTTSILFMTANKLTTAANAIVLQYFAPAVVIGLNALFLKQKPKKIDLIMVGLTIFGIVLFFVDHLGSGAILGDALAMFSSITFALVFFANRLPGANAFQSSYLGCALHIFLLPSIFNDKNFASYNPIMIVVIVLMGVVQMGFAYIFFAKGIAKTTAVTASIIATIEPILNPIWVFLIYNERPTLIALLGAAIVIVSITAYNILISKTMEKSGRIEMSKK